MEYQKVQSVPLIPTASSLYLFFHFAPTVNVINFDLVISSFSGFRRVRRITNVAAGRAGKGRGKLFENSTVRYLLTFSGQFAV